MDLTNVRAKTISKLLFDNGFHFEFSTRIDQVYNPYKGKEWHIERMKIWRYLTNHGMDRALFGVESGVDTILQRFNKNTTKLQNERAINILSVCDIPMRLTYITFDPLMSMNELIQSYLFLGRKDLLLKPHTNMNEQEIYDIVESSTISTEFFTDVPLYQQVCYMLVSLECLIGSNYLKRIEQKGLAGSINTNMGRKEAKFLNKEIGIISYFCQLWIDRNFTFDYLLKSITKLNSKQNNEIIYQFRSLFKDYAYMLLGYILAIVTGDKKLSSKINVAKFNKHRKEYLHNEKNRSTILECIILEFLDYHFFCLVKEVQNLLRQLKNDLNSRDLFFIESNIDKWSSQNTWKLINSELPFNFHEKIN
jgi:hypothetical protein